MLTRQFKVTGDYDAQGSASYLYDPLAGQLNWNVDASAYGYPLKQNGVFKLDKKIASSANVKVGEKLNFGPLSLVVVSIANKIAQCQMSMDDDTGQAQFDLSGEYIVLKGVQAVAKVSVGWFGITANVQLVAQ